MHTATPPSRSVALDLLRITLCAGVIMYHYTPDRPSNGPFMVIGFFVLSGFLLGLAFERMDIFNPVDFYSRKGKRFLPMLITVFLFLLLARFLIGKSLYPVTDFSYGNFSIPLFLEWYNVPTWFLGVELIMLLAAPFFLFLHQNKNGILFFFLGSTAFTFFLFSQVPYASKFADGLYFSPVARCWQFVAGILAAQLMNNRYQHILPFFRDKKSKREGGGIGRVKQAKYATPVLSITYCLLWITLAILKQESVLHYWNYTFSFELISTLFFIILIPYLFKARLRLSDFSRHLIHFISTLTYPIYLLHIPSQYVVSSLFCKYGYSSALLIGIIAVLFSIGGSIILIKLQNRFID